MFDERIETRKEREKEYRNHRETQKRGGPVVQTAGILIAMFKG